MSGETHYDYIEIENKNHINNMFPFSKPVEDNSNSYIDLQYRFKHPKIISVNGIHRKVMAEVTACFVLECKHTGFVPGEMLYKTTLLPGECVRIFSLAAKPDKWNGNEKTSECRLPPTQHYLKKMKHCLTNALSNHFPISNPVESYKQINEDIALKPFSGGPSVVISGSHCARSIQTFLKKYKRYAAFAHKDSLQVMKDNCLMQLGEVQGRIYTEGKYEDIYESSSHEIKNNDREKTKTYMFYQVNGRQHISLEIKSIHCRVIDEFRNLNHIFKETAYKNIEEDLTKRNLIDEDGCVTNHVKKAINMELEAYFPVRRVMVKCWSSHKNALQPSKKTRNVIKIENIKSSGDVLKYQAEEQKQVL